MSAPSTSGGPSAYTLTSVKSTENINHNDDDAADPDEAEGSGGVATTAMPPAAWFEEASSSADSILSRAISFVSSLRHFEDPEVEVAYLDFCQFRSLALHSVGSLILGLVISVFFTFTLPHWEKRRWAIVIPNLITGGLFFLLSAFCFICWRQGWFTRGYQTERVLVIMYALWLTALSLETSNYVRYYPDDAGATIRKYATQVDALGHAVDMQAFASFTVISTLRPRFFPYVVALMSFPFVLIPIVRWTFIADAPFPEYLPIFLIFATCLTLLYGGDEVASRGRFKDNARLQDAMRRVETSKNDVNNLMLAMISEVVLLRLVAGGVVADAQEATVIFSDVAGFTSWSSQTAPLRVIKMLCEMYRHFDSQLEAHNMEKVTTIGDAYWAACGIPTPQSDHARYATLFAVEMARGAQRLRKRFGITGIRVGVATGVVLGGVIGREEVSYQLFGEVNEHAGRMEQLAPLNGVLVSRATADAIGFDDTVIIFNVSARAPDAFEVLVTAVAKGSSSGPSVLSQRSAASSHGGGDHPSRGGDAMAARRKVLKVAESAVIDFSELRQRYGAMTRFGSFVEADIEKSFASGRKAEYVVKATRCAVCWVMWNVMAFGYAASRLRYSSEATWATAYTVMTALCAILAVAVYAASSHVHWIVHAVHHVAQANVHNWFIVFGPDLFAYTGDVRYACASSVMFLALTGFPLGVPELSAWLVGWGAIVTPAMVALVIRYGPGGVDPPLLGIFFALTAAVLIMSSLSSAGLQRNQCLDRCVTTVASDAVGREHAVVTLLLSRAMPSFVLPELSEWLARGRKGFIAHQFATVAVMFIKIKPREPPNSETDAHGARGVVQNVGDILNYLTTMSDAVQESMSRVQRLGLGVVVRLKVLGDMHLLAAGLDSHLETVVRPECLVSRLILIAWHLPIGPAQDTVGAVTAGIHCGPVAGGVIGDERLIYDIFGDTVNTASRVMATSCAPGIYLSGAACQTLLPTAATHVAPPRLETSTVAFSAPASLDALGSVAVTVKIPGEPRQAKGKGEMTVYAVDSVMQQLGGSGIVGRP